MKIIRFAHNFVHTLLQGMCQIETKPHLLFSVINCNLLPFCVFCTPNGTLLYTVVAPVRLGCLFLVGCWTLDNKGLL